MAVRNVIYARFGRYFCRCVLGFYALFMRLFYSYFDLKFIDVNKFVGRRARRLLSSVSASVH